MKSRYVIALMVGLFVLALLADRGTSFFNTDRVRWMSALDWAITALGVGIAAISGLRLLQLALQGAKLPQIMPPVVALFAGLGMYQRFWAVPISFAAILISWLLAEHFRPSQKGPEN